MVLGHHGRQLKHMAVVDHGVTERFASLVEGYQLWAANEHTKMLGFPSIKTVQHVTEAEKVISQSPLWSLYNESRQQAILEAVDLACSFNTLIARPSLVRSDIVLDYVRTKVEVFTWTHIRYIKPLIQNLLESKILSS